MISGGGPGEVKHDKQWGPGEVKHDKRWGTW